MSHMAYREDLFSRPLDKVICLFSTVQLGFQFLRTSFWLSSTSSFPCLRLLQVLVTDFFGSVMGIKHTEAAYVGFTGRSKESTSSRKDSSSGRIVDVVNKPPFDISGQKEKVECPRLGTSSAFDGERKQYLSVQVAKPDNFVLGFVLLVLDCCYPFGLYRMLWSRFYILHEDSSAFKIWSKHNVNWNQTHSVFILLILPVPGIGEYEGF